MSIFYRIIIILLLIAAGYSLFGIGHFHWLHYKTHHPRYDFTLRAGVQDADNPTKPINFTEFVGYKCEYCKAIHPTISEALKIRKDVRYVVRPIEFDDDQQPSAARLAIAAGLQGKFWEFHEAFLEKPDADISSDFVEEIAMLYGIDHDRLLTDANSKKVEKMVKSNLSAMMDVGIYSVPSFMINKKIYSITGDNKPDLKQMLELLASEK